MAQKLTKTAQYQRVFNHFDENRDGKISPVELQQCVSSIGFQPCSDFSLKHAESVVESLDSDGDGLLGFDDFVKFIEGGEEEEKIRDLKEAFKLYYDHDHGDDNGEDGDYYITPRSLKRMLKKLGVLKSEEQCVMIISQFDLNGDGVLNFHEFLVMMS